MILRSHTATGSRKGTIAYFQLRIISAGQENRDGVPACTHTFTFTARTGLRGRSGRRCHRTTQHIPQLLTR